MTVSADTVRHLAVVAPETYAELERAAQRLAETMAAPAFRDFVDRWNTWQRHHPPALCIDGHAYRRRTRNRRKR